MKQLKIDNLTLNAPVIQGGMGVGVSLSGLASAVANAGGMGVISATGIGMNEKDFYSDFMSANKRQLRKEIRLARSRTSGALGVNLMVALSDYDELLKTVYDEEVDAVFVGAGLPLRLPGTITPDTVINSGTKFIPIVSSARAAEVIFNSWDKKYGHIPDAVVVEGPLAGGHLGFKKEQIDSPEYSLEKILPEVLKILGRFKEKYGKEVPVIAAGGIFSGEDIHKFMQLGAGGVQMGTRFVATKECDASIEFKMNYINCRQEDIIIINSPVGLPGRAIKNEFLSKIEAGYRHKFTCPCRCLKSCKFKEAPYCIALALTRACDGILILDEGFTFAGHNASRINKIITVEELFRELKAGYESAEEL